MKKVYICHPISTTGEFNDSIRVAERIKGIYRTEEVMTEEGSVMGTVNEPKCSIYAPALNKEINDKSNNPTPAMIYDQDVDNLLSADVVVANYTGGDSDGTVLELGMLAGMYEMLTAASKLNGKALRDDKTLKQFTGDVKYDTGVALSEEQAVHAMQNAMNISLVNSWKSLPTVLVYSSNKRALQPQLHHGIASGKLNHMVLGAIDKHFKWCGDEEGMIRELQKLGDEK